MRTRHPHIVRDHLPLQQGLRPISCISDVDSCQVRDHLPLQQGLRPSPRGKTMSSLFVRDHLPLQQGLRLYVSITEEVIESVRDHFHRESPMP